jgi:hypothetical protein
MRRVRLFPFNGPICGGLFLSWSTPGTNTPPYSFDEFPVGEMAG